MKVIRHIKIKRETVGELLKLDAVERVELWHDGNIVVFLKSELTEGKREAMKDEYLVQYKNGKWQRYGSEAYQKLFHNPSDSGNPWNESQF